MVSIAAIAMSNYKMVYGGNDAAQTDNKFGVWFNVQRNPNTWHFLWKWTISGLLILNMNIPLVPIESICGSPDPFTVTITDLDLEMAGFPSEQWQGTFKKGSEGHEAQQPPWQSWCWPLWTLRCHAEPHRGCETGVAQMARALDLEMAGFPSEQWQGTFKQEVWAMRLSSHTDKAGAGHSEHFAAMQNHIAVVEQGLLRWRELWTSRWLASQASNGRAPSKRKRGPWGWTANVTKLVLATLNTSAPALSGWLLSLMALTSFLKVHGVLMSDT